MQLRRPIGVMKPIQLWLPILNKFSNLIFTNARSHPFLFKPGGWLRFCFNQKGIEYILAFNIRAAVEICLPQLHNLLSPPSGVNFCEPFFRKSWPLCWSQQCGAYCHGLTWLSWPGWMSQSQCLHGEKMPRLGEWPGFAGHLSSQATLFFFK